MWWCCRKATDGAGTVTLDVMVLQESQRRCRDRNTRCGGVDAGTVTLDVVCCGNVTDGAGTRILEVVQRQNYVSICCTDRNNELLKGLQNWRWYMKSKTKTTEALIVYFPLCFLW
jgi:hypothetical protein